MDIEKEIYKIALMNAIKYEKVKVSSIVNKCVAIIPGFKEKIRKYLPCVKRVVKKVNSLSKEEIKKEIESLGIEIKEKEEKKDLPELPNAEIGKVVTTFPPEPSKFPHLGHAKAAFINWYYARKYKGKFILRFEDTNPEKCKLEYYDAFREGLKWLGLKWDEEDILSHHLKKFYEITEMLIKNGKAYVCLCPKEKINKLRKIGKECEHRNQAIEKNLELWEKMLNNEFDEGEATVRLKIDMQHKNPVMRDPSIMRISKAVHPITGDKHIVWPLYDFGTALMDAWENITHRFRSKEFEMRTKLQDFIREACGFKTHPIIQEIARFEIKGFITSGRKIRELIKNGVVKGWDDPRLLTLKALKRRGFLPEAIKDFLLRTGVSKAEGKIDFETLATINRQYLDAKANRYFFVSNPFLLEVKDAPEKIAKINYHPDFPERGFREILTNGKFYISKEDADSLKKGDIIRLIDVYNIEIIEKRENKMIAKYHSDIIDKRMKKIQWVSLKDDFVKVKVKIPFLLVDENGNINEKSLTEKNGIGESWIKNIKIDERVQFVRFGFVKLENVNKEFEFLFIHK